MKNKIDLKNILFLDIETVPQESSFSNLAEEKPKNTIPTQRRFYT